MAKSREKIQQTGFWDEEVSKPDHDAICLWAHANAESIFRAIQPERFDVPWQKDEVMLDLVDMNSSDISKARSFVHSIARPNPKVESKIEFVLKSYTGYQDKFEQKVGYADLMLKAICPSIKPIAKSSPDQADKTNFNDHQIHWGQRLDAQPILVEVKSILPTLGELMRQINLYRTAFNGKFVVIAPDDKYAEILADQGVKFIQYKPLKTDLVK